MSRIVSGTKGFIYVLVNGSMEGVLKIGATTDDPHIRAKQISAATASPTPFFVAFSRAVSNCTKIEKQIHEALAPYRVNDGREFFRCPLDKAIVTLDRLVGMGDTVETPFAELFLSFGNGPNELSQDEQFQCRQLEQKR